MRIPRLFSDQEFALNTDIALAEGPSHHALKVLRMSVGRALIVFNGHGGEYHGEIIDSSRRQAIVRLHQFFSEDCESPLQTELAIGISRGDRFDFVLQKATELGVSTIVPLFTERTEVKLNAERLDKKIQSWQAIIQSACEQSGRNRVPLLQAPVNLSDYVHRAIAPLRLVLHHRNPTQLASLPDTQSLALLVGPEGGLSDGEINDAENAGFQSLRLGPRVLRTETAPICALSLCQHRWGDI